MNGSNDAKVAKGKIYVDSVSVSLVECDYRALGLLLGVRFLKRESSH